VPDSFSTFRPPPSAARREGLLLILARLASCLKWMREDSPERTSQTLRFKMEGHIILFTLIVKLIY
jgi:hypothetical protein